MDTDSRTVWCGNISDRVTEDILFELFLQAAPVEKVHIPTDKDGRSKCSFGFVTFKHDESVDYAVQLLNGISLFDRRLNIKPRSGQNSNMLPSIEQEQQHQNIQNQFAAMTHFNDLFQFGEMMQLGFGEYNQANSNYTHTSNWQDRNVSSNWQDRRVSNREERRRNEYKPYRQHDNRQNNHSNNRQSQNFNDYRDRRSRHY